MLSKDFRKKAWTALSGKWGTFAVIVLIYAIISAICGVLSSFAGIGSLIALLITGPFTVAFALLGIKVIRGEGITVADMFNGFKNLGNTFLLYLTNQIFIFLWSLLLIIPGIIKSFSYSMSYYIMAENPEISASEARKQSIIMMQGNKWRLFCLHFSFIGWYILCGLTFGILYFWVAPYVETATAAFYEDLKIRNANAYTTAQPTM